MKNSYLRFLIPLVCLFMFVHQSAAQTAEPARKTKQFIYVLRLVPRLHADSAWTKDDEMALSRHLARFKHAIDTGELILAGRTMEPGDKTFGKPRTKKPPDRSWRAILLSSLV